MVDYWPTNVAENPCCPHGPTLLFSRKPNGRKFFACSAFRDRKKCPFFQWFDDPKRPPRDFETRSIQDISSAEYCKDSLKLPKASTKITKNEFCFTCDLSVTPAHIIEHSSHNLSVNIDNGLPSLPTSIVKTKEVSKGESQYHFCDSTVNTFVNFFQQLQISSVLCIGCPRLHEHILNNRMKIQSMLLDIDDRYKHFYNSSQFQLFNMFNCHCFDSDGWKHVESFIRNSSRLAIIVDPPFGGRIEPLECSLNRLISLQKKYNENADTLILLILPYFMEAAVQRSFPSMFMLDYKVEYRNHRRFKKRNDESNTKGSAVRIFTNYSPSKFILPAEEGYKYCVVCDRWVCSENLHCYKCKACTSKNGGRYRHCNDCNKCVKVTWKHCRRCRICKLREHSCSSEQTSTEEGKFGKSTRKRKRKCKQQILPHAHSGGAIR